MTENNRLNISEDENLERIIILIFEQFSSDELVTQLLKYFHDKNMLWDYQKEINELFNINIKANKDSSVFDHFSKYNLTYGDLETYIDDNIYIILEGIKKSFKDYIINTLEHSFFDLLLSKKVLKFENVQFHGIPENSLYLINLFNKIKNLEFYHSVFYINEITFNWNSLRFIECEFYKNYI